MICAINCSSKHPQNMLESLYVTMIYNIPTANAQMHGEWVHATSAHHILWQHIRDWLHFCPHFTSSWICSASRYFNIWIKWCVCRLQHLIDQGFRFIALLWSKSKTQKCPLTLALMKRWFIFSTYKTFVDLQHSPQRIRTWRIWFEMQTYKDILSLQRSRHPKLIWNGYLHPFKIKKKSQTLLATIITRHRMDFCLKMWPKFHFKTLFTKPKSINLSPVSTRNLHL